MREVHVGGAVYLLVIGAEHGIDVTPYASQAGAQAALEEYVDQWWGRVMGEALAPEGEEKIQAYFSATSEWGEIRAVKLQP